MKIFRVFSPFVFAGEPLVATITIKPADDGLRLYAIEALDVMRGERLEVHLAAEPRQFKTTRLLLTDRISYYVGDVNRTHPKFVDRDEMFSIGRTVELLERIVQDSCTRHQAPGTRHLSPPSSFRSIMSHRICASALTRSWRRPSSIGRRFATLTFKGWVKLLIRGLLGCGDELCAGALAWLKIG